LHSDLEAALHEALGSVIMMNMLCSRGDVRLSSLAMPR
jgi:hypothetical protein